MIVLHSWLANNVKFAPRITQQMDDVSGTVVACEPNANDLNVRTFARAKCQPDGTLCEIGDCSNGSYEGCKPDKGVMTSTVAEYELEKNSFDTYDVSVINGPTFSAQIAPEPSSKPSAGRFERLSAVRNGWQHQCAAGWPACLLVEFRHQ
jgi:thaumatin family protein